MLIIPKPVSLFEVFIFNCYWTSKPVKSLRHPNVNMFKKIVTIFISTSPILFPLVFPILMNGMNTIYLPTPEKSGHYLLLLISFTSFFYYFTEQWLSISRKEQVLYPISIIYQWCDLGEFLNLPKSNFLNSKIRIKIVLNPWALMGTE